MLPTNGKPRDLQGVCTVLADRVDLLTARLDRLRAMCGGIEPEEWIPAMTERIADLETTEEEHAACLRIDQYRPSPHAAGYGGS